MYSMLDRPAISRLVRTFRLPRRQVFLFLLAVCLPCALLLFLGARTVIQDRELSQKRLADRRQQLADAVGRALLDRLERIKLEEATAFAAYRAGHDNDLLARGATVFVAQVDSGGVQMAWTADPYATRAARALAAPAFAAIIARGVHAELVAKQNDTAAAAYRAALGQATDAAQVAYAEVLLGRALRSARHPLARASYERVLHMRFTVRDEQGIPFALYAARTLAGDTGTQGDVAAVVRRARAELLPSRSLSLPACYTIADLAAAPAVRERCLDLERAHTMATDASVLTALRGRDTGWAASDSGRWLASIAPATTTHPSILLAVRLDSLADAIASLGGNALRLVASTDKAVQPIGHGLHGIGVRWSSDDAPAGWRAASTNGFYVTALAIVLGVVLLGGYLLWRDVERELRLARLRSQFVASVSHELKTPLTSIRIFAETLRDRANVDPKARHEYLETIARESDRLTRLLQNVLDFSRVERGERTYQFSPQQLPVIVERAIGILRIPLEQQGFTVPFTCDDDFAVVRCDPDAVEQAVLNLVSNAIKYSGRSRRIDVRVEHRDDAVAVIVRDYGIGIAPAYQQRLFERFYRAPTTDNDVIPGTGLGLTLVHHLAEAHGGAVTVESAVGHGSTFTLRLPVAMPAVATTERPAPASAPLAASS
jgi:signal transduction histidine kinase